MRTIVYLPDHFFAGMFNTVGLIAIRVSLAGDIEGSFARSSHKHLPVAGVVASRYNIHQVQCRTLY